MKAVILAGGVGSRISEASISRPKPMIEIGGKPILWHIMKIYSAHGVNDFVVCCGYKGYVIKEYFANYFLHASDVTFDIAGNRIEVHSRHAEPWRVTVVDTGEASMTGGRIRRIRPFVGDEADFCLTYGDGVGDVDITGLIAFHRRHGAACTLTAVQPPGRFGNLGIDSDGRVASFHEKPDGDGGWINGGFFVCKPSVIDRIAADDTIWEREPMASLASDREMRAFMHRGFWQPMDTLRDHAHLERLWSGGDAPWKVW
jgi:glucose-1-phosphate cytidylyltransferase